MKGVAGPRAVFGTTKAYYVGVYARAMAMYNAMLANIACFGSPPITLVAFLALITTFAAAQTVATETKAKGAAALRDTKGVDLWSAMQAIQKYVQGLADAMPAKDAASLILSAGLLVAKPIAHQKAVLTAALTATQGDVLLDAHRGLLVGTADASKKVTFNWQWSVDGKMWNTVSSTPVGRTQIPGLTLLTTYSFRVSVTVGKEQVTGPWSQAVSLRVH